MHDTTPRRVGPSLVFLSIFTEGWHVKETSAAANHARRKPEMGFGSEGGVDFTPNIAQIYLYKGEVLWYK